MEAQKPVVKVPNTDPVVKMSQSESELRLLNSGEFSDFTIVCRNHEWKVHRAILSKVPYFRATMSDGFKEAIEAKINIDEIFEPFEIQWLLSYIYFPHFDADLGRFDTANKSYMETCVRLWHLGDYFQIPRMMDEAENLLSQICDTWVKNSATVDTTKQHGTYFIFDLESGLRQAWREDMARGPLQEPLTALCIDFAPFLRHEASFKDVLKDLPEFAVEFSQRALRFIPPKLSLPK